MKLTVTCLVLGSILCRPCLCEVVLNGVSRLDAVTAGLKLLSDTRLDRATVLKIVQPESDEKWSEDAMAVSDMLQVSVDMSIAVMSYN